MIFVDVTINEVLQRGRYAAPCTAKAALYFLGHGVRDILGAISIGIEHDYAQRIAVLAGHEIGDGGLIVGAVEVGLGERGAEIAVMIDNKVIAFEQSTDLYA